MPEIYLHNHKEFKALINIVSSDLSATSGHNILPYLVEKDYWIMHVLYGLTKQGFDFELKGGTSLSKGYKIIDRFSEDIDIYIHPDPELEVEENPKRTKPSHCKTREDYFDHLTGIIEIDGIIKSERDIEFDNRIFTSGGIRLKYESYYSGDSNLKDGVLLEVGFDTTTPFKHLTISSWVLDYALDRKTKDIIDNRAVDIKCYLPGYTFVEKLQTITRKFRQELEEGKERQNLMRQYYDVYNLLSNEEVLDFIGTENYIKHKAERFKGRDNDIPISENEAYLLSDPEILERFKIRYQKTADLYYKGQPSFDEILKVIHQHLGKL